MLKHLISLFLIVILSLGAKAQFTNSVSRVAYAEIDSPTSLNGTAVWNHLTSYPVYLPFTFYLHGQAYTAVNVQAGGGINFPGSGYKQLNVWWVAFAGGFYLKDKGTSTSRSSVSYRISGTAGNRVLKVQWKNAGFKQVGSRVDTTDYVDYQIWLFETDSHIEIHFGRSSTSIVTWGGSGSADGTELILQYDTCSNIFCIIGPANLPSYSITNYCSPTATHISGVPDSGIVYNIRSISTGVNVIASEENGLNLYPNPSQGSINVSGISPNTKALKVINLLGVVCSNSPVDASIRSINIPIDGLPAGNYFLTAEDTDGSRIYRRFVKQ